MVVAREIIDPRIDPRFDCADAQLLYPVLYDLLEVGRHRGQTRQATLQLPLLVAVHRGERLFDLLQDAVAQSVHVLGAAVGVVQRHQERGPGLLRVARLEPALLDRTLEHVVRLGQVQVSRGIALSQPGPQHVAEVVLEDSAGIVDDRADPVQASGRDGAPLIRFSQPVHLFLGLSLPDALLHDEESVVDHTGRLLRGFNAVHAHSFRHRLFHKVLLQSQVMQQQFVL
jgi:hypothetical protein